MPGVRTDLPGVDWYIVRGDKWDLDGYFRAKGDPNKLIVHWLSEMDLIEPWWSNYYKRVEKMRSYGIKNIVYIDYSTWEEWPLPLRIYNIYRGAVTANSLIADGFKIVMHPNMTAHPHLYDVYLGHFPQGNDYTFPLLLDAHSGGQVKFTRTIFKTIAVEIKRRWPNAEIWLWSKSKHNPQWWASSIGSCVWVKTRSYMQSVVIKERQRRRDK